MAAYPVIREAPGKVLEALRKGGGALSPSELVLSTRLPYDVVHRAVHALEEQGQVNVKSEKGLDIAVVHLL
jgi:DNA-binding IclR family transcriptional regulator